MEGDIMSGLGKIFLSLIPKPERQGYYETRYRVDLPKNFDPQKEYSGRDLIRPYRKFVPYQPIPWENATVFNYLTRTGAFSDWPAWWKRGN